MPRKTSDGTIGPGRSKRAAASRTKRTSEVKATASQGIRQRGKKSNRDVSTARGATHSEWTLTGISEKTGRAVTRAARKEGEATEAWVDKTLYAAATRTIKGGAPLLALPPDLLSTIGEMSRKLDRIDKKLNAASSDSNLSVVGLTQTADEFRKRAGNIFDEMQKSASHIVESAVEHTDSTVAQIKQASNVAIASIKEAADAALESVRDVSGLGSGDRTEERSSKSPPRRT